MNVQQKFIQNKSIAHTVYMVLNNMCFQNKYYNRRMHFLGLNLRGILSEKHSSPLTNVFKIQI